MATKEDVAAFLTWLSTPPSDNGHRKTLTKQEKDEAVWAEEEAQLGGPPVIADIRDPRVRAEVRRIAAEQEKRLEERLIAAGLHASQRSVA
jgi:hypothetical protein